MPLLVLAYPLLSPSDMDSIQSCREKNDPLFSVVQPHFTLVFAVPGMEQAVFIKEIRDKADGSGKIDFVIRSARVVKDAFSDTWYTFLVPDEGYDRISSLHDRLYSGMLKSHHRLDIDYIPHITASSSSDARVCKQLADDWNKNDLSITGRIQHLTIVNYENGKLEELEKVHLY